MPSECPGYCGSIALPISREPDRYSEQEHRMDAMSELGCSAGEVLNLLWSFVIIFDHESRWISLNYHRITTSYAATAASPR